MFNRHSVSAWLRRPAGWPVLVGLALGGSVVCSWVRADALEDYVRRADASYAWKVVSQTNQGGFQAYHLQLTSQTWRTNVWRHDLRVVVPPTLRNPQSAFLLISGDGSGSSSLALVKLLAERAGAVAAVVTRVPNQPLFGRKEDALIAYTFDHYLQSGDPSWPLLFPMAKSAVRAMDALQEFAQKERQVKIEKFVLAGASKRGWTTWLTAAVDPRVQAIAPMVIDMLNMKAQTDWARKVYGRQSDQIHDYTDLNLIEKMGTPPMAKLTEWVDPYSYRARYTLPKLLLLGSNDPYWTVDSLRHYWNDLPEPKLIFQTPNAGHDLAGGREASQTLAAFFALIADGKPLPRLDWQFAPQGEREVRTLIRTSGPAKAFRLWTAQSPIRDFRKAQWTSESLGAAGQTNQASAVVMAPTTGYRAYLLEATLTAPDGHDYRLSTEARVVPDTK